MALAICIIFEEPIPVTIFIIFFVWSNCLDEFLFRHVLFLLKIIILNIFV